MRREARQNGELSVSISRAPRPPERWGKERAWASGMAWASVVGKAAVIGLWPPRRGLRMLVLGRGPPAGVVGASVCLAEGQLPAASYSLQPGALGCRSAGEPKVDVPSPQLSGPISNLIRASYRSTFVGARSALHAASTSCLGAGRCHARCRVALATQPPVIRCQTTGPRGIFRGPRHVNLAFLGYRRCRRDPGASPMAASQEARGYRRGSVTPSPVYREDPKGEEAYQRAFEAAARQNPPRVPNPLSYPNSPSAREYIRRRDQHLFGAPLPSPSSQPTTSNQQPSPKGNNMPPPPKPTSHHPSRSAQVSPQQVSATVSHGSHAYGNHRNAQEAPRQQYGHILHSAANGGRGQPASGPSGVPGPGSWTPMGPPTKLR